MKIPEWFWEKGEEMPMYELFIGEALSLGGLSNEEQLAKLCPHQFSRLNSWSLYVRFFRRYGADTRQWKWRSTSEGVQTHQLQCFVGLLDSRTLPEHLRLATAGWMLSEMLVDVPEHLKPACLV